MRNVRIHCIQPAGQPRLSPFHGERDHAEARRKIDENVEMACRLLDQAGRAGCDIVGYPEDVQGIAHYGYFLDDPALFTAFIETVPGPITERLGEVARRHAMHVVVGLFEREGETLYNTAALLGRDGKLLGKYRKVHLPMVEKWGTVAGDAFPVFATDFGTVGMLICYDLLFPEAARALALNGAELLFNPTMSYDAPNQCEGGGLLRVRMRALDNFTPLVVPICGRGSLIVDSFGNVVAQAEPGEAVIQATLDLDATPEDHSQWELFTGTADVKARLFQERRPETYSVLAQAHPPVWDRWADRRLRPPSDKWVPYEEIRRKWSR